MTTYQTIELRIKAVTEQTAKLAFMNKEELFNLIAEIVDISDTLNNFIHDLDLQMAEAEAKAMAELKDYKATASMANILVKQATSALRADKEWAGRQVDLLSEIRIAVLAAQRSNE